MPIMIREFLKGNIPPVKDVESSFGMINIKESMNSFKNMNSFDPNSLMVEIEGIHADPFYSGNHMCYTQESLKKSVPEWTHPYRRPLLKHHNEENGEPIGRIISAEYITEGTGSGTPALKFIVNIPDKDAINGIKNGLLLTTSVGMLATDVHCSICGSKILSVEEGCPEGHIRGAKYQTEDDTKICLWRINEFFPKELSFVDVPGDIYSKVITYYPVTDKAYVGSGPQIKEALEDKKIISEGDNAMEKELKEAKEKVATLEAQIKEANEKAVEAAENIETLKTKISELEKANEDLKKSADDLAGKIEELEKTKSNLEDSAKEAEELRESMEQEITETKAELKESLADTFVTLRQVLGRKPVDIETIKGRSFDSLKDSIIDMKESLADLPAGGIPIKEAQANDDGIDVKENKQKDNKEIVDMKELESSVTPPEGEIEVKESREQTPPIDLKAGLQNIFQSIISR